MKVDNTKWVIHLKGRYITRKEIRPTTSAVEEARPRWITFLSYSALTSTETIFGSSASGSVLVAPVVSPARKDDMPSTLKDPT